MVIMEEGDQFEGQIREKAKFPMIRGADGSIQRAPFSRYFVRLAVNGREALVDDKHLRRDRKVFTKQNLRAFLKNSLQREAWTGAPWLVKEHLAIQYRLPMEIPAHLLQEARLLQSKQQMMGPKPKGKRNKSGLSQQEFARLQQEELRQIQRQQQQHPGAPPHQHYHQQQLPPRTEPPRPPPPVIKYPIEDLDLPLKRNGVSRPELKFFTEEMTRHITNNRQTALTDIQMESVGMLLEVWNTLNVQAEVYVLDSFTFDDFVDAMRFSSLDTTCDLFEEAHCAVLELFIDDNGKLAVEDLPKKVVETPADESEVQDESEMSTPVPDVPARSTRSRLSHMESATDIVDSTTSGLENANRAAEMVADRGWFERLAAHDFEDGGWQVIVIGILHQLSGSPVFKARCEQILAYLAPLDMEPTRETAESRYATMDINLRISALQMLTILTVRTKAVKEFLENCSEDMTDVRKRKIEHQRERKIAFEELQVKEREKKIMAPQHIVDSPKEEESMQVEPEMTEESIELNGAGSSDAEEEAPAAGRSLRRAGDRKRKRDEDAAKAAEERAKKAEADKAKNKQDKAWAKIKKEVDDLKKQVSDQEEKIAECDADLREANVQRTKVLGKDRFCNRYYWFERNGQPFGGLPSSSTAGYGYANGRIWIQGPDEMEREGFIIRTKEEQAAYQRQFSITVPERRKQEEGPTILDNAREWGYIDDPDRLDNLIGWLDDRGEREKKLRKELIEWRDRIAQYMEAHKKFKDEETAKKVEADEEASTRVTTRHKVSEDQAAAKARCLRWTNLMAVDQKGHLHSRPPKPKKERQSAARREAKGVAVPVNRQGKPVTRQGEHYKFGR